MTKPQCPIPQVEDALAPYIHTREKTTRIRQILTQQLTRQVHDDNEPTHLSLSLPPSSLKSSDTSLATDGLYRQYLQALKAHRQARERYDTIKDELDHLLKKDSEHKSSSQSSGSVNSIQDYADLLRQRRQQRKLEIIQDALTKLLNTESHLSHGDIKASVKQELGEPPQPPVGGIDGNGDLVSKVDDLSFKLKKELLVAKNKFVEAKNAKAEAETRSSSLGQIEAQEKISILQHARDELIAWVETELAKIPEDEIEASQAEISFMAEDADDLYGNGEQLSNEEMHKRVEELYNRYLSSRQRYISEVEATLERTSKLESHASKAAGAAIQSTRRPTLSTVVSKNSSVQAAQLLPHLTSIASTTREEALVQQQMAHLRRQLVLASDETDSIVQRLAGESLLVPQNSNAVSAWAKAAAEANEKTKAAVLNQVIEGESSMSNAKMVLKGLRARKQALESLQRNL